MQIVIEVPEKTINHIRSDYGHGIYIMRGADKKIICEAIVNGTPLPKGHGRLIDADALEVCPIDITDLPKDKCLMVFLAEDVNNAPTIIEAERTEE